MCILKVLELFMYVWFDIGIIFDHASRLGTVLNRGARPHCAARLVTLSRAAPFLHAVDL
jgi:hypothetical protein